MKIMIFTEGTILMHSDAVGHTRDEIVQQVVNSEPSVKDYAHYIPIGNASVKIQQWVNEGAEIVYLTSRKNQKELDDIRAVLIKHNFPKGELKYREKNEEYKNVAEGIIPDVLIEDDCESIGGKKEMTYPHIVPQVKKKINSIVVKEFSGIDGLSNNIESLCKNN